MSALVDGRVIDAGRKGIRRGGEITVDSRDEILGVFEGDISLGDFARLTVMTSSRHLELAANKGSGGNLDLSSRTEQQAASIQQAAGSKEELAGTVRGTADQARTANAVAEASLDAARRGNEAVAGAGKTMKVFRKAAQSHCAAHITA